MVPVSAYQPTNIGMLLFIKSLTLAPTRSRPYLKPNILKQLMKALNESSKLHLMTVNELFYVLHFKMLQANGLVSYM